MTKKKRTDNPFNVPMPGKHPETKPPLDPPKPALPQEEPNIVPDEEPFEKPPYEMPVPDNTP